MNKKIGIVTTFWSKNYGAALQAFAMQTFLENNGYETLFINYQESRIIKPKESSWSKIKNAINEHRVISLCNSFKVRINSYIWEKKYQKKIAIRESAFENFVDRYLNIGDKCNNLDEVKKNYINIDCFVCGSDQIWNPLVYGFSDFHFLSFVEDKKRIAYAPSIAKTTLTDEECKNIIKKIEKFDAVSVRESASEKRLCEYLPSLNIRTVLDPTFLISRETWNNYFKNIIKSNEKYILVYLLSYNQFDEHVFQIINKIATEKKLKVIELPFSEKISFKSVKWEKRFNVSPAEFMSFLINAEIIVTNSFHATALSIINNKEFYVVSNSEKHETQSRIDNILEIFNLTSRYIKGSEVEKSHINYESVNNIKNSLIEKDKKWFLKSIEQ